MTRAILVVNAGSSSIKFALYDSQALDLLLRGAIDNIGAPGKARFRASGAYSFDPAGLPEDSDHDRAIAWLIAALGTLPDLSLVAAGHRVVHGGARFAAPVKLTADVLAALTEFVPLAPGHQPHNLAPIRALMAALPALPQVACFDTAFHRGQPRLAQLFPIPRDYAEHGVLRYGFHGLSYDYIASVLPTFAPREADGRVIIAHLGHGASMCAMAQRRSVATTMGFTALDGLMMATRCGAIDPGLVLHLIQQEKMSPAEVSAMLHNRSGLLGISGLSDDMRVLEASSDPAAREAIELFAYRCGREMGSLIVALGGLDALVFTAGIGENSALVRALIASYLGFMGVVLDAEANVHHEQRISAARSAIPVLVIPTDEEIVIARATRALLAS